MRSKRIAIFASGEGTNTQRFIEYFRNSSIKIALIVCNNPDANVLKRAERNNIPSLVIDKRWIYEDIPLADKLKEMQIDFIVCAGFLWKIPREVLHAFPKRIVNIHPALLPKFGGKGMYGGNVHEAVLEAGESESGITIHYVNEHYDEGEIILQRKCPVTAADTAESLAEKVHNLEYEWYPGTVEELLKNLPNN